MIFLLSIDIKLTKLINFLLPHIFLFDQLFFFLTTLASSAAIWIFITILLLIFAKKIDKKLVVYLLISLITITIINQTLKIIVKRPRPCFAKAPLTTGPVVKRLVQCPKDYSFPSGHASSSFAAAVILATFDKKRKRLYWILAVLIGLSRIYLEVHYVGDVVVGAFLGLTTAKLVLLKYSFKKEGEIYSA